MKDLKDDDFEIVKKQFRSLRTRIDELFDLFICDEIYKFKTIKIRIYQSFCFCRFTKFILIIVISTINKSIDFYDILSLFAKVLKFQNIQSFIKNLKLSDFDKIVDDLKLTENNLIDMKQFADFVHSNTFRRLTNKGSHMFSKIVKKLLSFIF